MKMNEKLNWSLAITIASVILYYVGGWYWTHRVFACQCIRSLEDYCDSFWALLLATIEIIIMAIIVVVASFVIVEGWIALGKYLNKLDNEDV